MIFIFITIFICFCTYFYYKNIFIFNKNLKKFPCPPELPILGHALDFISNKGPLEVLQDYINKYGDIVRIKTGPKRQLLLISDYNFLQFVLTNSNILEKSIDYKNLKRWLGTGLLTGGGPKWKLHRLLITPAFHQKILEDFVDIFEKNAKIFVKQLEKELNNNSVNIYPLVSLCTLDIICETTMGVSVQAQENTESEYVQSVKQMLAIVIERAFSPHKMFDSIYFFTESYKKEIKAIKILHSFCDDTIKRRKEATESLSLTKKKVFLDLLLDEKNLTMEEIREEVNTFMFAGHDTTASAVSFALFALANHPEEQAKVLAEQKAIFDTDFHNSSVTMQHLKSMKYLEMVIKETLRLYPSVPFIARELLEDVLYEDVVLPKGLTLTLFIYSLQRNPKLWEDPEEFRPSRFESKPFAFLPFSIGPRNCIGQKFAMLEMKSVISQIIRNFELLPSIPRHQLQLETQSVLVSKNGIHIRLKRRQL